MKIPPDYSYLLKYYSDSYIFERMFFWTNNMRTIIEDLSLKDFVRIDDDLSLLMVLYYFSDIVRLKEFHQIQTTNSVKFFSYSFYWILRTAPIQIIKEFPKEKKNIVSINAAFVVSMWASEFLKCLSEQLKSRYIYELLYFFKYREYTAQTIEAMLNAFFIGSGEDPFHFAETQPAHITD